MLVDDEFRDLIPRLGADERAGLEACIVRDGRATVPLVVWQGLLLDGHNRYEICTRLGLPYTEQDAPSWIASRRDARIWIRTNALDRRNLGPVARASLVAANEPDIAARNAEVQAEFARSCERDSHGRVVRPPVPQNFAELVTAPSARETRARAADLAGMSHPTYVAAKAIAREAAPELREAVDQGHIAVSTGVELLALPAEKQREIAAAGPKAARLAAKEIRAAKAVAKHKRLAEACLAQMRQAPSVATVHRGDAVEFLATLAPGSVDLIATDPPYSTDVDDIEGFARSWLPAALACVAPTGRVYVCCGAYSRELRAYLNVLHDTPGGWFGRSQVLVWLYRNRMGPSPTHRYQQNWQAILYAWGSEAPPLDAPTLLEQCAVQDIDAPTSNTTAYYHPWQKPDALASRMVRHASEPGQCVVDPFAGTGTVLIAAAGLGRKAVGCELSEDMISIAVQRGCVRC